MIYAVQALVKGSDDAEQFRLATILVLESQGFQPALVVVTKLESADHLRAVSDALKSGGSLPDWPPRPLPVGDGTVASGDFCLRCDRETCNFEALKEEYERLGGIHNPDDDAQKLRESLRTAEADCISHAVDWPKRAKDAETKLRMARATGLVTGVIEVDSDQMQALREQLHAQQQGAKNASGRAKLLLDTMQLIALLTGHFAPQEPTVDQVIKRLSATELWAELQTIKKLAGDVIDEVTRPHTGHFDPHQYLMAEEVTVSRILRDMPHERVLERQGLEARLRDIRRELDAMDREAR